MAGIYSLGEHSALSRTFTLKALLLDLVPEDRRNEVDELFQEAINAGRRNEALTVHSGNDTAPPAKVGLKVLAWARYRADAVGGQAEPDSFNRFVVLEWAEDEMEPDGGRWADGGCGAYRIERWWPLPTPCRWQAWNGESWEALRS